MIVVKLKGGLGNQLFQYATSKSLSLKHNTDLYFDFSLLDADTNNQYTKRNFELHLFDIKAKKVPDKIRNKFLGVAPIWCRITNKLLGNFIAKYNVVNQTGFEYDFKFEHYGKNTYLNNGYWQSEKFFKSIRNELLKELVVVKEKSLELKETEQLIQNNNSISIHIRRGDYVTDKNANAAHGILPLDYYVRAIEYIKSKNTEPVFFIFSDDIEWAKKNLVLNDRVFYIDFNKGDNSIFDMHLMSLCKHNIIANSSFSWWAAWLNQKQDKVVIAPKNWFQIDTHNTKDLIPDEWVVI